MGALLEHFAAAGVQFEEMPGNRLRVVGPLDENSRATIRDRKQHILAELRNSRPPLARDWRIDIPGRPPFSVTVVPPADEAWMLRLYPGARAMPCERERRYATPAEA